MMKNIANELTSIVSETCLSLKEINPNKHNARSVDGKWSVKETLGHLIDSAENNHDRIIGAQANKKFICKSYDADLWVRANAYHECAWTDLVERWRQQNVALAEKIENIEPAKLSHQIVIGTDAPVTLEHLVSDYIRHLCQHLQQIDDLARAN